jgi:hypothetical protein
MLTSELFDNAKARTAIAEALCADLSKMSVDDLKRILAPAIEGRLVTVPVLDAGTPVYRARCVGRPAHIRDVSYPPASLTPPGRVNREGAPVFYCSAAREGALFEVAPRLGETVVVAKWTTTEPMVVHPVGYSKNALTQLQSRRAPESWAGFVNERGGAAHAEITDFFATTFVRVIRPGESPDFYKLSTAIAEMLFAQDMFHGLLYPTVALAANSDNLAIKPSFVDQHLRFVEAELFQVQKVHDHGFEVLPLDLAQTLETDGSIVWRGRPKQLVIPPFGTLALRAENGRWVARDSNGHIVEPE